MSATRRQFLTAALGAAAVPLLPRFAFARAASSGPHRDRALVLVELSGGNDGLNTVVPFGLERYHELRPTLRVQEGNLLKIDEMLGLRSELRGLKSLYDVGQVAIVQGVGYPGPDRSHFRSADIWHAASLTPETTPTGWIGRLCGCDGLAAPTRTPALMVGSEKVPLLLVGERGPAPQIASLDRLRFPTGPDAEGSDARVGAMQELARGGKGAPSLEFLRDAARTTLESSEQIERASREGKVSSTYPATPLGGSLKLAAQLLLGGLDCTAWYVRQNGYDTHAFQAETHGLLLQDLGDSLAAFWRDLEAGGASKRVVVLVWSEFGRRLAENGSKGTDHGAAAPLFVLGPVKGGLVGAHPSLEPKDLDPEQDLRFTTDFRSIYATLLEDWLGVPQKTVLSETFPKLPLFRRSV